MKTPSHKTILTVPRQDNNHEQNTYLQTTEIQQSIVYCRNMHK